MSEESRRAFLLRGTAAALSLPAMTSVLASCDATPRAQATPAGAAPSGAAALTAREKSDAIDAAHEKSMKAFPASTTGKGNMPLAPRIENGVKIFDLTTEAMKWETEPGKQVDAFAYNGMLPGPLIRVRQGDRVRVNLSNKLPQSTVIHFHGLEIPNAQDGVSYMTQPPVKPGESYSYEFTVPNAGSHMYHSHHNSTEQVAMGLLGAFLVDPADPDPAHRADVDVVLILNDGVHGYTFNGKSFPATEPIACKRGQTVRIRFMNEGMMIHPMHLHGNHMTVIAKDGWDLASPWRCDTLNVAPGERWDVLIKANNPGTWAFHCHILQHAENMNGMFGMVTAMVVS